MDESEAFTIVNPICCKLCVEGNVENVNILKSALKRIDSTALQVLQEYVLFPLRFILQSGPKNEDLAISVMDCIREIFSKSSLDSWKLFLSIYNLVISFISHPKNSGEISNVSEELKIAVVECTSVLFSNCDIKTLENIFKPEFLPALGHVVFVLLRLAENENNKDLRIKSIECLQVISSVKSKSDKNLKKLSSQAFSSFIPGISGTLTKIITGNIIQGHRVTVVALNTWADVICLVLGDENLALADKINLDTKTHPRLPVIDRNEKWIEETEQKLKIFIEKICELVCHNDWRVRLGLVNWANKLLMHCNKSFVHCIGLLLDVLITLSEDEYEKVSATSCDYLQKCALKLQQSRPFSDTIGENIHDLITKLPRIFHTANDSKKLTTLHLLIGYVQLLALLDENMQGLMLSYSQLNRLGLALVQLSELDCSNVQLLAEKSKEPCDNSNVNEIRSNLEPLKKIFRHFQDPKIYSSLVLLCRLLGRFGDVNLLIDHCLDLFHHSTMYRNQSVLLMQEILTGAFGDEKDLLNSKIIKIVRQTNSSVRKKKPEKTEICKIVKLLLDEYLDPEIWYLPISVESRSDNELSVLAESSSIVKSNQVEISSFEQLNSNLWLICLLLESIASFFKILEGESHNFLMRIIYPLLEKMGSSSALIAHSAFYTADVISYSVGCRSIAELIHTNADYLVNSLSIKLQHIEQNPESPRVLKVVFQNCGPEVLPLVADSVEELLLSLDTYHRTSSQPFLEVLNSLIKSITQWFPPNNKLEENINEVNVKTLRNYFDEYKKLKEIAEGNIDDETNLTNVEEKEEVDAEDNLSKEKEKEKSLHVKFVTQTMQRCIHLLARKQQNFTLLVLNTIELCVIALQDWTDDLLPLVHQVWSSFKLKFSESNLIVVKKAYETLLLMAKITGDFIRKRTLDDVWNKLLKFLHEQAKISQDKHSTTYKFTAAYKYQLTLLNSIGELTQNLKISDKYVDDLVYTCVPYLSTDQDISLQEAAIQSFLILIKIEPDVVWLQLSFISVENLNFVIPKSSVVMFTENIMAEYYENIANYQNNVGTILHRI